MSEPGTLRERIERAAEYFYELDGVVLTTFSLSSSFLEDHALPAVLGVEAKTTAARRAELHQRLVARAEQMAAQARRRTEAQLLDELGADRAKAEGMLDWFEQALLELDRGVVA